MRDVKHLLSIKCAYGQPWVESGVKINEHQLQPMQVLILPRNYPIIAKTYSHFATITRANKLSNSGCPLSCRHRLRPVKGFHRILRIELMLKPLDCGDTAIWAHSSIAPLKTCLCTAFSFVAFTQQTGSQVTSRYPNKLSSRLNKFTLATINSFWAMAIMFSPATAAQQSP